MKKLLSTACAAAISLSIAAPLQAAPLLVPKTAAVESDVIKVGRNDRKVVKRIVKRGDGVYMGGYKGYDYPRKGYKRHDDFWFPLAAFAAGAIISGAIHQQPRVIYRTESYGGDAHVEWCYDRYISYRHWDNTFQPYHGPRRQCHSPFG